LPCQYSDRWDDPEIQSMMMTVINALGLDVAKEAIFAI
jgi:hypothetical protein